MACADMMFGSVWDWNEPSIGSNESPDQRNRGLEFMSHWNG